MAKPSSGAGHNSLALTDEEREALFLKHLGLIRDQNTIVAKQEQILKELKAARNKVRNVAKNDGFPLVKIDDILKKEGMSRKDLEAEAELFRDMDVWAGMPVGGQKELFATSPEEVKDEAYFEALGYQAGIRGEDGSVPSEVPPRFTQAWMLGWGKGQERLGWAMQKNIDMNERVLAPAAATDDDNDGFDWGEEDAEGEEE